MDRGAGGDRDATLLLLLAAGRQTVQEQGKIRQRHRQIPTVDQPDAVGFAGDAEQLPGVIEPGADAVANVFEFVAPETLGIDGPADSTVILRSFIIALILP